MIFLVSLVQVALGTSHADEHSKEYPVIKVAILDQLMSQKLSSIIYQEDYLKGIKLAGWWAEKHKKIHVKYRYFSYPKGPLGVLSVIPKVKAWKPDFIIGPRSSNSMLLLKEKFQNILVSSPMATSPLLSELPDNFYTFSHSDISIAKAITLFTKKNFFPSKGIMIFTANDCISCKRISDNYTLMIRDADFHIPVFHKEFSSADVQRFDIKNILKNYKDGYLFFIPNISYVSGILMARILDFIRSDNVIFIGSDGWGSQAVAYAGKIKTPYKFKAWHMQNWSPDTLSSEGDEFKKDYVSFFGKVCRDNVSFASWHAMKSVISTLDSEELSRSGNNNKYILFKFLGRLKTESFRQEGYVFYRLTESRDIPEMIINPENWKYKRVSA